MEAPVLGPIPKPVETLTPVNFELQSIQNFGLELQMSRLASFHGPSTPSKSPVEAQGIGTSNATQTPTTPKKGKGKGASKPKNASDADAVGGKAPSSPLGTPHKVVSPRSEGRRGQALSAEFLETPFHASFRQIVQDIKSVAKKWDETIKGQSFKAAKELVDARTTIGSVVYYLVQLYL
jgi:hypothetical protein